MALGYFPAVFVLLLLETAKITGETTTKPPTSPPTKPRPFASVADTTSGMKTTTSAEETTESLPSSVALLSNMTHPWSTNGETTLPGGDTAPPSSSSPEGSTMVGTHGVSPPSSSLAGTSISSIGFGSPSEVGTTHTAESTLVVLRSTTKEVNSSPPSPTPLDKRTSEGPLTTISTTSPAETTSEKHPSSPPLTTETIRTSPWFPPLTSTLVTSMPTSVLSGDTTGSSEVTTGSKAEITSGRQGTSSSSTSSSVTQDRRTSKATSTGPLSSNSGRTSLGLSTPSSTNLHLLTSTTEEVNSNPPSPTPLDKRTPEGPSTIISVMTQEESTSKKHLSSPPFTTETMKTSPLSIPLPTPTVATSILLPRTSSSPEGSTPVGTSGVSPASSSLEMTPTSSTGFGGPSEVGTIHPAESTMLVLNSTTEVMNSSPPSPTPLDKRTSEGPLTTISTTSPAETTSEKHPSSPPLTTETIRTFPWFPPLTSTLVTSMPTSVLSGDTTGSSEVTTGSKAEITSGRPGTSSSSTSSSVTQDRRTSKATSTGPLSSNSERTSLGPSAPSSTNLTSGSPATTLKVLSSTPTSPSASTSVPHTPARNRFMLSVRFSTQLNITDPSISHAVRKWLGEELQSKFPLGSFNLGWIG